VAYRELVRRAPEAVAAYQRRLERYDGELRSLGVKDHELDEPPTRKGLVWVRTLLQVVSVFVLLPPILLVGCVMNALPTMLVSLGARGARWKGKEEKDIATIKLLGGLVVFPATWALWGWLAVWRADDLRAALPWLPDSTAALGAIAWALGIAGAIVMMLYIPLAVLALHALRVRVTRGVGARALLRLREERAQLCDDLLELAEGIELPGAVGRDGRVTRLTIP
jgi:hypothetical protein